MNSLVFFYIIFLNLISILNQKYYKIRYDSCDERWANESLWSNYISKTESTICNDFQLSGKNLPSGFVTLIANAFANRNITCGGVIGEDNEICNPSILNKSLKKCIDFINDQENNKKNITLFKCIGLKKIEVKMMLNLIDDYIYDGYTLLAADGKNKTDKDSLINRFIIEGVYDEFYLKTLDYRGKSSVVFHTEVSGIEVFRVYKTKKIKLEKNKVKNNIKENINLKKDDNDNSEKFGDYKEKILNDLKLNEVGINTNSNSNLNSNSDLGSGSVPESKDEDLKLERNDDL
jgi:hypothetical protein